MADDKKTIPYGKHYIDEDDIQAVVEVLRGGWITQGPKISELERAVSSYVGAKYAVAVSSGTAALHLAYLATGLGKGSTVVTSANTFVASANCIMYGGGHARFCDIDPVTLNMDPGRLAELAREPADLDAVIPVHFGGLPCDMEAICKTAKEHGLKVIEDASHAFGATYADGSRVGNCRYSDATVFSLHPVKGITAGEGGIVTTNSKEMHAHLLSLRSHGINKGNFDFPGRSTKDGKFVYPDEAIEDGVLNPWYYEMQELGFNYRITDFQCALVLSQLKKSDLFLSRRKEIVRLYDELLSDVEQLTVTQASAREQSSNHLYVVRIDFDGIGKSRGRVMRELMEMGVGTQVHYIPVTRQPYYNDLGINAQDYPKTERYYREALTLPVYFELETEEAENVVKCLRQVLGQ